MSQDKDRLYDRLVLISGTPGSGKTTLARLFQYRTVKVLLDQIDIDEYRDVAAALVECGMVENGLPTTLTCRIPLGGEYRDFWEFPYPEDIRTGLLESMLQARTCLAWIQNLKAAGHATEDIKIIGRSDAEAASAAVGLETVDTFYEKAKQVELDLYRISAALLPPSVDELLPNVMDPYRPFDVIERFEISTDSGVLSLRPLVIFDDVHELHADQFRRLESWLVRRELRVGRWIMTRLDALSAEQVLQGVPSRVSEDLMRVQTKRDITEIRFQSSNKRRATRTEFSKMATDMSSRYISKMPVFERRGISRLSSMLGIDPPQLTASKLADLKSKTEGDRERLGISDRHLDNIRSLIAGYVKGTRDKDIGEDVQVAMERILLHRLANRMSTGDLFAGSDKAEPSKPLKCNSGVAHGARIHLTHQYDRPYYYGLDALCYSGSENAELFLQFAERLVAQIETKAVRNKSLLLTTHEQHRLLRERAVEMIDSWRFPECDALRVLISRIAAQCVEATCHPNAYLGAGANAFGISQAELDSLPQKHPKLSRVLQFGVAYSAITLVPNHSTKKAIWCLIELGGAPILHHQLPFLRGGFVEGTAAELAAAIAEVDG